ncbi:succinate dehydrogenase cytochrome B subunit [Rhizoctonia solani 123E]|uniref:Succinate dehydrogenase cytochrome B subunit n=1 Tax=Rhizoctonia solani 123E TaxID=1423351 RepID=A0A074S2N8_9AGAM|nr:succinate dehydrogenase cytochrome B subunit [Rhizoctonia solani 123E]
MIASRVGLIARRQSLAASRLVSQSRATPLARQFVRSIQTESLPPSAATEILNAQRVKRPSSPHFTIYQPQITWIGSIANRITGGVLSGGLYLFALAYLAGPVVGIPVDTAHVVDLVASLPDWFKYAVKGALGMSFSFHSWNGIRHLLWDAGRLMTNTAVMRSGYAVIGLSVATTIGLLTW